MNPKDESEIKWTEAKENVLKTYAEESQCMYITYTKEYVKYRLFGYFFTIPSIIISTVTGLLAFDQGFNSSPNGPFVIGGLNIFVAVVGTIYKVLKYGDLESQFKFLAGEHLKLYAEIQAMLVKCPEERENSLEYIRKIENRRLQLIDDAPVISDQTRANFKRKYKNQVEELPVLLEKINKIRIYGKPIEKQLPSGTPSLISDTDSSCEKIIDSAQNVAKNLQSAKEIFDSDVKDPIVKETSITISETSLSQEDEV